MSTETTTWTEIIWCLVLSAFGEQASAGQLMPEMPDPLSDF